MSKEEMFAYKQLRARVAHGIADGRVTNAFPGLTTAVDELTKDGFEAFVTCTADRILAAHRDDVIINRCPQCDELARTPRAKQCRFCGHDWHNSKR
jgi:hypothetical protein